MTADVDKRITLIGGGADRVTVRAGDHVIGMLWGGVVVFATWKSVADMSIMFMIGQYSWKCN